MTTTARRPAGRAPSTDVPAVRTFQMDSGRIGDIANSVNLYRGTVTLPLELVTLPGRNGLDVKLAATYGSHVHDVVHTWNAERPTGVMGVGWMLPFDAILLDDRGSTARSSNRYYLVAGERADRLVADGGAAPRGRTSFQTMSHAFWKIAYDPGAELWEVVHEDGTIYRYGGRDSGAGTVQWGVGWGNWVGSSAAPAGQQRYATGWNLWQVENLQGDRITYTYENVEQGVGGSGPPYQAYTKASYLASVTDVFGRTVRLRYEDKTFSPAERVCEFQDPRRRLASAADARRPDAYQSRYETRYLDRLEVSGADGAPLFTVRMAYAVRNLSGEPTGSPAYPFLAKRYLTGVTREMPDGEAEPGFHMEYWGRTLDGSDTPAPNPGALRSVAYPTGAAVRYTYERQAVAPAGGGDPRFPLRQRVDSPLQGGSAVPAVWFGPDYTVVTWWSRSTRTLTWSVYRWVGRWVEFRAPTPVVADVAEGSLRVEAREDFFCVTWTDPRAGQQGVRLFRRDPARFGAWKETALSTALADATASVQAAAGDDFVVFASPGRREGPFWGWGWNWRTRTWDALPALPRVPLGAVPRVTLAAAANYFVAGSWVPGASAAQGTLTLALVHRDPANPAAGGWSAPSTTTAPAAVFAADKADAEFLLVLSPAETAVFATFATAVNQGASPSVDYEVRPFSWDAAYRFIGTTQFSRRYTAPVRDGKPVYPVLATVAIGAMAGNGGNLLRYAGGAESNAANNWAVHDRPAAATGALQFAYGADAAVVRGGPAGSRPILVTYDPAQPGNRGFAEQALDAGAGPPTLAAEVLTAGDSVFVHSGSGWSRLPQRLPAGGNWETMLNRARFLVWENASATGVSAAFLHNGQLAGTEVFADPAQRLSPPASAPGAGARSAGTNTFATFAASGATVFLYRVARGTATGPVHARPVVAVELDDGAGGQVLRQAYEYDATTVVYDPGSSLAQYSRVTLFPGGTRGAFGRAVYWFSNGVSTDAAQFYAPGTPINYSSLLSGQLLRQEVYAADGTLESASTITYAARETAASTPGGREAYVPGAWVRPVRTDTLLDGVHRYKAHAYSSFSGLVTQTLTQDFDPDGSEVQLRETARYAYEVAPYASWALARNALGTAVQLTRANGAEVTFAEATEWKEWLPGRWAPAGTWQWLGTGVSDFPFAREGDAADGWLRTTRVTARLPAGLVATEQEDVDGVPATTVYDTRAMNPVASFAGASARGGEAAWYGFEEAEENPGWAMTGGGALPLAEDGPCTGQRALRLAPSAVEWLELSRTPARQDRPYLFTCSVRTAAEPAAANGAAWEVALLRPDGAVVETRTLAVPPTEGRWQTFHAAVDLADARARNGVDPATPLTVRLRCGNRGSGDVWVDDTRFSPLHCEFTARAYDAAGFEPVAQVGPRGEIERALLDRLRRVRARSAADGRPSELFGVTLRPAEDGGGTNAELKMIPAGPGFWGDFDSTDLARDWEGDAAAWTVELATRTLRRVEGTGPATLSLRPVEGSSFSGVQVEVLPPAAPRSPIQLSLGTGGMGVRWSPEDGWALLDAGGAVAARAARREPPRGVWTLLALGRTVMFFFGGRQLFQQPFSGDPGTGAALTAQDAVGFRGVAAFQAPSVAVTFADGFNRRVQEQMFSGTEWIGSAWLYDAVGSEAARTRPVPRAAGEFGWWADMVRDVDLDGTGTVGGAVAAYYRPGGGGPSDDGGFPFSRTRHSASPLARVVEQAQPGRELAIDPAVPVQSRRTVRTRRGATTGEYGFAAGRFYQTAITDPNGNTVVEVRNARDQLLLHDARSAGGESQVTRYRYTAAGELAETVLPNAALPGAAPDAWRVRVRYDFLGRMVAQTLPDLRDPANPGAPGTVLRIYDRAGRLRARQTPELARAGQVAYTRYDRMGRIVEEGVTPYDAAAGEAALRSRIETDAAWPAEGTWCRRMEFDGDGSDLRALLRLTSARAREAGAAEDDSQESFTYDLEGRVLSRTVRVPRFDDAARSVSYRYDGGGRVVRVAQSVPGESFETWYRHDARGLVEAIGTAEQGDDIATYAYNPDTTVREVRLNGAAPQRQQLRYNSAAWVTRTDAPGFASSVQYTAGDGGAPGYYDGSPAAWREDAGADGAWPALERRFRYDGQRLTRVEEGPAASASVEEMRYDPNGNLTAVTGPAAAEYVYEPGTNRLATFVGTRPDALRHDLNGSATRARGGLAFTYDVMTGLPRTATPAGGAATAFAYDAGGLRVLRDAGPAGRTVYLHGTTAGVMATQRPGETATFYVHGPTGLVASRGPEGMRWYVRDHMGSVRAVVAADGTIVAAFRYSAWGVPTAVRGSLADSRFLFTGAEWDADTEMYNLRARLYDPVLRRFVGMDPAGEFASPYLYGGNNPLRFADPSGQVAEWVVGLIVAAIMGAVLGAVGGAVSGIVAAVQGKWSAGEAVWKTALFTLVGAVAGALLAVASYGVGAAVGAVTAKTGTLLTILVRGIGVGVNTLVTTPMGAATGAANAAIAGGDPRKGAGEGALAGFVGGLVSGAAGEALGGLRKGVGLTFSPALRQSGPHNNSMGEFVVTQWYDKGALARAAVVKSFAGMAAAGAGTLAVGGINAARGEATWEDVVREVALGAFIGGASAVGNAVMRYNSLAGPPVTTLHSAHAPNFNANL